MIKSFLIVLTLLFAVSGIAELFHFLRLLFCGLKTRARSVLVLFLKSGEAVHQLDFAVSQQRWLGGLFADEIIAVYDDLSFEELTRCSLVADRGNAVLLQKIK